MAQTIGKYRKLPVTVDAEQYNGTKDGEKFMLDWISRHDGLGFPARELLWRHDMGCYFHPEHGFVYLPEGARTAGSPLTQLRDDELVVRTDRGIFTLVFPGDFVVRAGSGFYPLASESFHQSHVSNVLSRGTNPAQQLSPAV